MKKPKLPPDFVKLCKSVTAKRPKTVIDHILKHGHITTEELKETYGYNHPPRAVRDVKENGIPIEMFRVTGSDGRKIAAYRFGDPKTARFGSQAGRTAFAKELKQKLVALQGPRCAIYLESFPATELQIDHRVPFEVAGDVRDVVTKPEDYMLLCGSANRAKSWSCEHCLNWLELRKPEICRDCYWAYPDNYTHVAMKAVRRADILWSGPEIETYQRLKKRTVELQKNIPAYVKELVEKHLEI
ncbi:MAG: HNH endonuclease [Verrucomicrobiota bacterium]